MDRFNCCERQNRLPSMNHHPATSAVDCRDDSVDPDGFGERPRERHVRLGVLEQRGAGDDLTGPGREYLTSTVDSPDAAADSAGERRSNLSNDVQVVAGADRGIEVDDLYFWK